MPAGKDDDATSQGLQIHPTSCRHFLLLPLSSVLHALVYRRQWWMRKKYAKHADVVKKLQVLTAVWIWISSQLIWAQVLKQEPGREATPAEHTRSVTHRQPGKQYALVRIPWTPVLVGVWLTMRVDYGCFDYKVRVTPNPSSHGAEIRVSPSLLVSLPLSFPLFSVIPDLCPSHPCVCRHGNHSSLPPSFASFFPPSHFSFHT